MSQDSSSVGNKPVGGVNLLKLAKMRKYSELESAWMDVLEQAAVDWEALFQVPEYLARSNEGDQAVLLLWALVASAREKLPPAEALALAKRGARIVPADGSLKAEVAELYVHVHKDIPEIVLLVKNAGLHGGSKEHPADVAIERMDLFTALRPGAYVRDKKANRIGRVEGVEPDGFTVNVEGASSVYDPAAAEALEVLDREDLRALTLFEPDRVSELREDTPAELVRLTLKTFGGRLEFRQLKERMAGGAVPASAWSSWWAKAREAVKRSPFIEMTDDAQPYLVLRRTPLSYQERIRRYFQAAPTPEEKFEMVLDYLRGMQAGQPAEPTVAAQLLEGLQRIAEERRDKAPAVALGALALLGEFRRRFPDLNVTPRVGMDTVLAKIRDFTRIPKEIKSEDVQLYMLSVIKDSLRDQWAEVYAKLLPACSIRICDIMARELQEGAQDTRLAAAIAAIVRRPEHHPEAFIWLWKTTCGGKAAGPFTTLHPATLSLGLLTLGDWAANVNRPGDRDVARALITQVRHTIAANGYRTMRDVIEHASADEARLLRVALDRSRFLSDYARNDLIGILSTAHHELFVEVKKPWEEDVIYTTVGGLEKRQKELERIVNVELPKIAEAIGRAIGFGDVSDNAEYRSGLEQRDSLSKRATAIRQEIAKARLISHGMVKGDEVTVGAKVTARNQATGEIETFSFLGPWDTDLPNRVYSYQAPFSLAFMAKRKGEVVTAPGAEGPRLFEIIEIQPAL